MRVFVGDAEVARVAGPWTAAMLPQLAQLQLALGTTEADEECYRSSEGSRLTPSRNSSVPLVSDASSLSNVEFVLCAAQGQRTNDR